MPKAVMALHRGITRRAEGGGSAMRLFSLGCFLVALLLGLLGWSLGETFYLRLATEALIFAGLAISVDILLGFTGLLSLGQALYFGLGAYVSTLVLKHVEPSFWLAVGAALMAGTLVGLVGGLIANRVRGVYFALITFGMAQIVGRAVYNTRELGASDGIIGIPQITVDFLLFRVHTAEPIEFFLLLLAIVAGLYFLLSYLLDTPFGRVLAAIRANEKRVPYLGYRTRLYVLAAYVLAANVAALAGALYPMLRGFVSPELMFFLTSGNAVINVIVGGVGTIIGPVLGSVLLTGLRSFIGAYTEHHLIVIGLIFMISVMFFPKGIVGYLRGWLERREQKRRDRA